MRKIIKLVKGEGDFRLLYPDEEAELIIEDFLKPKNLKEFVDCLRVDSFRKDLYFTLKKEIPKEVEDAFRCLDLTEMVLIEVKKEKVMEYIKSLFPEIWGKGLNTEQFWNEFLFFLEKDRTLEEIRDFIDEIAGISGKA